MPARSDAADDARWMGAALALAERGRGHTAPNPCVGCVVVRGGIVVGRGWTQPGGRPHAEAMALAAAGTAARGATAYVTLEPCARPGRGPACAGALIEAGVARVVVAIGDPFPAVDGAGFAALEAAGIALTVGVRADEARRSMAGFLTRQARGRPFVTLKLATSLDGCIAMADGTSRWITGPEARAHAHLERSRHETILIGRGTWQADAPALDVRLPGLEDQSPARAVLTTGETGGEMARAVVGDVLTLRDPLAIADLPGDHLLVEGGAATAAAFLAADLVDRLLLYRAPVLIGGGRPALGDIGLAGLADAHDRWQGVDARRLGVDRLDVYERVRS
jgi:diaminohydroxyphosphoribosylaminopyrimidine deaminase/5-amino-6-(5-phosphoribosylamino)uracil reductase